MEKTMRYDVHHTTTYRYEEDINSCMMSLCMQPRNHLGQTVKEFRIRTNPATTFSVEFDAFGNRHHYFDIHQPHRQLDIHVDATIERITAPTNTSHQVEDQSTWSDLENLQDNWDMWEYLRSTDQTRLTTTLRSWLESSSLLEGKHPYSRIKQLVEYMYESFSYQPGSTHVDSTIDELLAKQSGVCQDYAHLMLACTRSWGIPSRYVSGYLYESEDKCATADNATHAWVECWLPNRGWLTFDPTNASFDNNNLITVALGRDYSDVAPSRGVTYGGGRSELIVGVIVQKQAVEPNLAEAHQHSLQQ